MRARHCVLVGGIVRRDACSRGALLILPVVRTDGKQLTVRPFSSPLHGTKTRIFDDTSLEIFHDTDFYSENFTHRHTIVRENQISPKDKFRR